MTVTKSRRVFLLTLGIAVVVTAALYPVVVEQWHLQKLESPDLEGCEKSFERLVELESLALAERLLASDGDRLLRLIDSDDVDVYSNLTRWVADRLWPLPPKRVAALLGTDDRRFVKQCEYAFAGKIRDARLDVVGLVEWLEAYLAVPVCGHAAAHKLAELGPSGRDALRRALDHASPVIRRNGYSGFASVSKHDFDDVLPNRFFADLVDYGMCEGAFAIAR